MGNVLEILLLQAFARQTQGDLPAALVPLKRALTLAEPEGYIRIFVDEGAPMAQLLSEVAAHGIMPDYIGKLLAVFEADERKSEGESYLPPAQPLIEPLSQRELEVLQLMAQGLSNREISERLFLALSTVKGHNRNIFDKLQVQRRTEAVARARELGLL
jgi:LuxR family maltose regulon positive regulatory protein